MAMTNKSFLIISAALQSLVLTGCMTTGLNKQTMNEQYLVGGYEAVASEYLNEGELLDSANKDLDDLLIRAKALHDAGYWEQSAFAFETAEKKLAWKSDSVDTPQEIGKLLATTLANDTFASYNGKIFEGVLLDYYQALNYLMLGDESRSRVRFNRLNERQANAETQLRKYTDSLSESSERERKKVDGDNKDAIDKTFEQSLVLTSKSRAFVPKNVKANEIRHPAGDLLGAIFRATSGAQSDQRGSLIDNLVQSASTKGTSTESRQYASNLATNLKDQRSEHIFILFEDGQGPHLDELRIDLPVFLVSNNVLYSGIALPEFKPGVLSQGTLSVRSADKTSSLVNITHIDRMASLEFDAGYKGKVSKAVTSAVVKTVAQAAANKKIDEDVKASEFSKLLSKAAVATLQYALTQADTRNWINLPKSIHMAILENKGAGFVQLIGSGGTVIKSLNVPLNGDVLIYARQSMPLGELRAYVQKLPAGSPSKLIK